MLWGSKKYPMNKMAQALKKPLTVAFLYNIREVYPDPKSSDSQLVADADDPQTIKWMGKHLEKCGYRVIPIPVDKDIYLKLKEYKKEIDIAFNYSVCINRFRREIQVPLILEILEIPYTGPSPLTQSLVYNKAKVKEILMANGISTLPFQVFNEPEEKLRKEFKFPLIVKPNAEGSSAGITNKSVVNNLDELYKQIKYINKVFKQTALVEPFLTGREFSVPMVGNPPRIFPIIESDHSKLPAGYQPLDSLEVKWYFEESSKGANFSCPAKITPDLKKKIENICSAAWKALNMKDFCRIDIRCDKAGTPYFIEINHPAGMIPPEVSKSSYLPYSAQMAGLDYDELLKTIIEAGWKRNTIY